MSIETTTLYRPVGIYELKLIQESGYTAFPPRHPEQPIFYPVLNQSYAEEIASKCNPTDENSGYMGAVTRFIVPTAYLAQYEEQVVGNASHRELWIPSGELEAFNQQIIGKIEVIAAFYGDKFEGEREW